MKRTSLEAEQCAVARSLDIIGDWWTLLIVRDALGGLRRFGEFQRSLGAARNILAARLKALVAAGILETAPASDGSAYQQYLLTDKGRALVPVLIALSQWSDDHVFRPGETSLLPVDLANRQALGKLEIRAADGRRLDYDEVYFDNGLGGAQGKPAMSASALHVFDTFEPPAMARADPAPNDIDFILDIPVQLTVELGRTSIAVRNLLQIAQGSVIELEGLAGAPMDVLINGCLIAQGEVVVVNDKFGIRLTDITNPSERIRMAR